MLTWAQIAIGILYSGIAHERQPNFRHRKKKNRNGGILSIDILGPRLPTHTWRGRHMYEESKMASSTGQKTRELYYEKQVFGLF